MQQKTTQIRDERYIVHEHGGNPWKILIKKGGNEQEYVPVFRTGWEDGGEVEIFSLLPLERTGNDTLLLQIRLSTKAIFNENKPGVTNPEVIVQCNIPAFVHIEPTKQRILIELLCTLHTPPQTSTVVVAPHPEIDFFYTEKVPAPNKGGKRTSSTP